MSRATSWVASWPAPIRHLVLVLLAAGGTAAWEATVTGKAPREVVMAALLAIGAVLTPLVQGYGVTGRPSSAPARQAPPCTRKGCTHPRWDHVDSTDGAAGGNMLGQCTACACPGYVGPP